MRSEKQIEASRNNGAKSNGPKSKEGKANAAKNSNRHNLTGSYLILLSTEDPVEFLHHENEYLRRFQPIDGVERDLVRKLIAASWREKRMDVMEASILELEMQKQAPKISREFEFIGGETRQTLALLGTEDMGEAWDRLSRYQAAARRSYTSALKALRELQGDRFNRQPSLAPNAEKSSAQEEISPETENNQTNPAPPTTPVSCILSPASFREISNKTEPSLVTHAGANIFTDRS
jgi:hypothetical protein